jgi:hypothetical protein
MKDVYFDFESVTWKSEELEELERKIKVLTEILCKICPTKAEKIVEMVNKEEKKEGAIKDELFYL